MKPTFLLVIGKVTWSEGIGKLHASQDLVVRLVETGILCTNLIHIPIYFVLTAKFVKRILLLVSINTVRFYISRASAFLRLLNTRRTICYTLYSVGFTPSWRCT